MAQLYDLIVVLSYRKFHQFLNKNNLGISHIKSNRVPFHFKYVKTKKINNKGYMRDQGIQIIVVKSEGFMSMPILTLHPSPAPQTVEN